MAGTSLMLVLVTGPISSGTRLVYRLLDSSPHIDAVHDDTHGFIQEWKESYEVLVIVSRERVATDSSRQRVNRNRMSTISQMQIIDKLRGRIPTLDVSYEDVCEDVQGTIDRIASGLGIDAWTFSEEVINQNNKWYGGPEPAPQLNDVRAERTILR